MIKKLFLFDVSELCNKFVKSCQRLSVSTGKLIFKQLKSKLISAKQEIIIFLAFLATHRRKNFSTNRNLAGRNRVLESNK